MSTFGSRLREQRNKKKLTQEQLGDLFKISESAVGMYERDQREPPFDLLEKFAEFFEVSIDYLISGTEKINDNNQNLFFYDINDLSEEDIEDIKKHIEFVKWQAKQRKNK